MRPQTISTYAREQARSRLRRFVTQRRRARKHLGEPKSIHDLRVSIRRLSQCLRMFRSLFAPGPARKLRRRLRKLMDLCAAVRNCDVALDVLRQAGVAGGASSRKLGARREVARRALRDYFASQRRHEKSSWMKFLSLEVQKGSEWALDQSLEANLARVLPAQAEELFVAGRAAVAAGAKYDSLHQFRLRTKRFRYALELFPSFYEDELKLRLQALGELQDLLGAINDCVTTIALLGKDLRGIAAVRRLLRRRKTEFRNHWKGHYSGRAQASWKKWLSRPRVVTE